METVNAFEFFMFSWKKMKIWKRQIRNKNGMRGRQANKNNTANNSRMITGWVVLKGGDNGTHQDVPTFWHFTPFERPAHWIKDVTGHPRVLRVFQIVSCALEAQDNNSRWRINIYHTPYPPYRSMLRFYEINLILRPITITKSEKAFSYTAYHICSTIANYHRIISKPLLKIRIV